MVSISLNNQSNPPFLHAWHDFAHSHLTLSSHPAFDISSAQVLFRQSSRSQRSEHSTSALKSLVVVLSVQIPLKLTDYKICKLLPKHNISVKQYRGI